MGHGNAVQTFFLLVTLLGAGIALFGTIWLYVETARVSILWFLGCLFLPFVQFVFLILHFDRAAKPTGVIVLGSLIMFLGVMLAGGRLR